MKVVYVLTFVLSGASAIAFNFDIVITSLLTTVYLMSLWGILK